MGAFAAILRKDLRVEIRSGQSTIALFALSLLIMVVLVFALNPQPIDRARDGAAALWVALVFAGMLGATRSMIAENENGCMRALTLSPIDPAALLRREARGCVRLHGDRRGRRRRAHHTCSSTWISAPIWPV